MKQQQKRWPDYEEFDHLLFVASTPFSGAYIHGMMIAMLACAGKPREIGSLLQTEIPSLAQQGTINELFNVLLESSAASFTQDETIKLLLPQDEESLATRIEALVSWCEGFLDGINKAKVSAQVLNDPLIKEVLTDIEHIKTVSTDVSDSEANEKDYMEVLEFIRVSVLLIYEQAKKTVKQLH